MVGPDLEFGGPVLLVAGREVALPPHVRPAPVEQEDVSNRRRELGDVVEGGRCRANLEHTRQSRPDSRLGLSHI